MVKLLIIPRLTILQKFTVRKLQRLRVFCRLRKRRMKSHYRLYTLIFKHQLNITRNFIEKEYRKYFVIMLVVYFVALGGLVWHQNQLLSLLMSDVLRMESRLMYADDLLFNLNRKLAKLLKILGSNGNGSIIL